MCCLYERRASPPTWCLFNQYPHENCLCKCNEGGWPETTELKRHSTTCACLFAILLETYTFPYWTTFIHHVVSTLLFFIVIAKFARRVGYARSTFKVNCFIIGFRLYSLYLQKSCLSSASFTVADCDLAFSSQCQWTQKKTMNGTPKNKQGRVGEEHTLAFSELFSQQGDYIQTKLSYCICRKESSIKWHQWSPTGKLNKRETDLMCR